MAATVFAAMSASAAAEWRGLEKENWCSGLTLTPEKLKGKVVLVERWGVHCPPCRRSLPHIEAIWKKFRGKPFAIIGSHCQGYDRERIAELVKTWPSEKAHCAKALQRLLSSSDVKAAAKLRRALETAAATTPRNALEAKKLASARKAAVSAAVPFAKSEFPGVASEIAELLADGG